MMIVFVSAAVWYVALNEKQFLIQHVLSAVFFFMLYFIIFKQIGGIGFGDVKYAAALGFMFGLKEGFISIFAGTAAAIVYAVVRYILPPRAEKENILTVKIPYGTFLSAGAILVIAVKHIKLP